MYSKRNTQLENGCIPLGKTIAHFWLFWQNRHAKLESKIDTFTILLDKINKSKDNKQVILGRLVMILTFFSWTLKQKKSLTQTKFEVKKEFHC